MEYRNKKIFLLLLPIIAPCLYSFDVQITEKELDGYLTSEFNRVFYFCWDLSAVGAIKLNERHTVKSGLAWGTVGTEFEMKGFVSGEAALPVRIPLFVSLAYNYNGIPEYESHAHSILPLVSFKWRRAGASMGTTLRFTSFFGETPLFEPVILSGLVYLNIIDNNFLRLGLKAANFNDFVYGNFGSYFLNLNSMMRVNETLSLINEIEIHQSGSAALASNFYGLIYRGGVSLLW